MCRYPTTFPQLLAAFNSGDNDGFPLPGQIVRKGGGAWPAHPPASSPTSPCRPSHGQIATADFDCPIAAVTTTVKWFNLSITTPLITCPQISQNSSVWMALVPKARIMLPTPGTFYDGIIWVGAQVGRGRGRRGHLGWRAGGWAGEREVIWVGAQVGRGRRGHLGWRAGGPGKEGTQRSGARPLRCAPPTLLQNFLTPNQFPYWAWSTGAGRYITSVTTVGSIVDTCVTNSGLAYVQQANWSKLTVAHVPQTCVPLSAIFLASKPVYTGHPCPVPHSAAGCTKTSPTASSCTAGPTTRVASRPRRLRPQRDQRRRRPRRRQRQRLV